MAFVQAANAQLLLVQNYIPSMRAIDLNLSPLADSAAEFDQIGLEFAESPRAYNDRLDDDNLSANLATAEHEMEMSNLVDDQNSVAFGDQLSNESSAEPATAQPDGDPATAQPDGDIAEVERQTDTQPLRFNPTGRDIPLSAPLRDGNYNLREVLFILGADDTVRVESKSLLGALRPILAAESYATLESDLKGIGYAPAAQLEQRGYVVRYDPSTIGLIIDIPAAARAPRDLALANLGDENIGDFVAPANFSGYVNFRSFADYVWNGDDSGLQAPTTLIDSAIRYKGFVLENEATLNFGSGTQKTFSRERTRLVYDDRNRYIRFAAGDLLQDGRGFSGSSQISGFSATRNYSIVDPLRNVQPRGDSSFTLTRPATVEAVINGRPVREIRLDPGTYNVRDFPFVQGTNDVQFNIEDDAGGKQTLRFSQFFDRTLLAPGLSEFSLSAGVIAPFANGGRDYQFSEPAASGWYRRGISTNLTLGGNFNVRKDGATGGVEVVTASALGTFGADLAVSTISGIGTGYAFNFGLQKTFGGQDVSAKSAAISVDYRSKNFGTPGSLFIDNRIAWSLSASYAQPIGPRQFVSLSGNYGIARGEFQNEINARLTYGYAINQRVNLTVDAIYEDRNFFGRSYGVRASVFIRLGRRSSGIAEVDSRIKRARLGYQTSGGQGVGAWSASGDVDVGEDDVGLNGAVSYTANRADLSINHTTIYDFSGQSTDAQRTSARFGTALVFADGRFGVSRPIFESFAMAAPHKSLDGASVIIDPREGSYTAKSGTFGAAVDPDLAAYIARTVTYDVPDAPIGYDLGAGSARVEPPYRGGYLIIAGSDYSVTAIGTLLGPDGSPISLLVGQATEQGVSNPKSQTIFTNRTGRFGISGLRPGRWLIEMPTEPPTEVEIIIPDGEKGIVRLEEITLGEIE